MENYFSEYWANTLQCISLPLEVIGVILALIEVTRPVLARHIEMAIDNYSSIRRNCDRINALFDKFDFEDILNFIDKIGKLLYWTAFFCCHHLYF